jgi:hypothetical protein
MLACKADCKYIGRLAGNPGKSNEAGLRAHLLTTKRLRSQGWVRCQSGGCGISPLHLKEATELVRWSTACG